MESIKFPVGRIMQGSVHKLRPVMDNKTNQQKTYQKGAKLGQPRFDCFFAVAIAKNPGETHFAQTEWGKKLWAIGNTAHPKFAASRNFAWKVIDGDSTEPDKNGVSPNTRDGWPGHWIVKFNNSEIPRIGQWLNGKYQDVVQLDFVKPGYFIEVVADVEGNGVDNESPGIYINHKLVCFRAYGPEIVYGPDPDSAGFGEGALPEGASSVPLAAAIPAIPAAAPAIPAIPAAAPAIPAIPAAAPAIPAKTMTAKAAGATYEQFVTAGYTDAMMIEQGYLQAPVTPIPNFGSVSGVPPVAQAAPVKLMTAKAAGATYQSFIDAGWNDTQLIEQGYLVG